MKRMKCKHGYGECPDLCLRFFRCDVCLLYKESAQKNLAEGKGKTE